MLKTTTKDHDPSKVADAIAEALRRAFTFFEPGNHGPYGGEHVLSLRRQLILKVCAEQGHDARLFQLMSFSGVSYNHKLEISFGIGVEVSPRVSFDEGVGMTAACELNWGSCGTLTAANAVATAALHLEAAQKACQAQATMIDALRRVRGTASDEDRTAFYAGLKEFHRRVEEGNARVMAEVTSREAAAATAG